MISFEVIKKREFTVGHEMVIRNGRMTHCSNANRFYKKHRIKEYAESGLWRTGRRQN